MMGKLFIECPVSRYESDFRLYPNREFLPTRRTITVTDVWRRKAEGENISCDF